MAYPADIPTFDSVLPGDPTTVPSHSTLHNAVSTALSNVMTTLGTTVNGAVATVRQRFEAIEANGWVTSARIADLSVQRVHIVAGAISTTEVANGTLLGDDLANATVTLAKMAADSVDSAQYVDGSIDEVHLANDIVTDAKTGAPTSGTLDSGRIAYARMGKIVHVWTSGGTNSGGATLPSGFRPATLLVTPAVSFAGGVYSGALLQITTGGVMTVANEAGSNSGWFNVSFTTP